MSPKRILFIGGSGVISASSVNLAVERGHQVSLLNRGRSSARPLPAEVEALQADATDADAVNAALGDREFDVVAQFRAFTPDHVAADVRQFSGRTGQYVFISSASAYQKPPSRLPVTESTPLQEPVLAVLPGQDRLRGPARRRVPRRRFPGHDRAALAHLRPDAAADLGDWTDVARMRAGKPVVVHGDGTTQWTLTHADDFAVAFVGLLGHPAAVGDDVHDHRRPRADLESDLHLAGPGRRGRAGAGARRPETIALVASGSWSRAGRRQGALDGVRLPKVSALVPDFRTTIHYADAAVEQVAWFDTHPDQQVLDDALDAVFDRLVKAARSF